MEGELFENIDNNSWYAYNRKDFDYGDMQITVDSTDFSKVSYDDIIEKILNYI